MGTTNSAGKPIKVGLIADQTGPLSFVGLANVNVARMVIGDLNAKGGLLGRHIDLCIEDSATDDATAARVAAKLVESDKVDVIVGGIYSSTRQAIKGPAVTKGRTLYIYPEQYEGQEADPRIFCTGPVPAQQVDPFIPWLMQTTGAKTFYLPSADYVWPHVMNARVREIVTSLGGSIVGEEYYPMDHLDYCETVKRITASRADVVFNTIVPPGVTPFFEELYNSGFQARGGHLVCTYFDENFLNMVPAMHVEGLYGCLDYYEEVTDPFSQKLLAQYDALYPGAAKFTGGSACSGLYRALRLWASAVTEAGSLDQARVISALDHARIPEGPGGPAEMIPGQHHVRMQMYIAQARSGRFKVVHTPGAIDPKEQLVESACRVIGSCDARALHQFTIHPLTTVPGGFHAVGYDAEDFDGSCRRSRREVPRSAGNTARRSAGLSRPQPNPIVSG
ncbi:MAG: substrate-binding protein [Vicinamibacterales bacterium]